MIAMTRSLPAGNAIRLWFTPPAGAVAWRVLRSSTGAITGPNDPAAVKVRDLSFELSVLDIDGLTNGTPYTYQVFYQAAGGAWIASQSADVRIAAPDASYVGDTVDPQGLVRERLELGLAVEVQRGALKPATGRIEILTAPFAIQENISFPVVSVHLDADDHDTQAIGEELFPGDQVGGIGDWTEYEGRLSKITLGIVGVSLNGDERIALRQAIQRVLYANLPVFDDAGMVQIALNTRDEESQGEDNTITYRTRTTLSCLAPSFIAATAPDITAVPVTGTALEPAA